MRTSCIYMIKNRINGKMYIGQTINLQKRWGQHLYRNKRKGINQAIKKYGMKNFDVIVVEENIKLDKVNEREKYWIKHFNTFKGRGYNLNEGGEVVWCTPTPEARAKMSEAARHRPPISEETREKLRVRMQGMKNHNAKVDRTLGEQIYWEYKKDGVTQYDLADKYDLNRCTIHLIVNKKHWTTKALKG